MVGYEIVEVPHNSACPKEYVKVQDPRTMEWHPVVVLYDTGATLTTGTMDLIPYDQRTLPALTNELCMIGVNAVEHAVRFDHILVRLQVGDSSGVIPVNCKHQSKTSPPKHLDLSEWRGVSQTPTLDWNEASKLPLLVMGADLCHWHPKDLDLKEVPEAIRKKYPGLSWKMSKLSGNVLSWGREWVCLLYTSPSPRDYAASRMPSSA